MKWQHWFRSWLTQPRTRRVSRPRTLPRGGLRRRTITPRLEMLEDRTLPSTFTVTNLLDDGSAGSLRYEIQAANSTPGANTIDFAHGLHGVITLTQGQLNITNSVAVNGPGAALLTISGNSASRIFDISSGKTMTLAGLTLTDGQATTGAGIYNAGALTLSKDVLSDNVAQGAANGGNAVGGGLYNNAGGVVTIDQSTFTGNQALGGDGGVTSSTGSGLGSSNGETATLPSGIRGILVGVGMGGGLWNDGGALTITNSTFRDNLAQGGNNSNVSALPSSAQFVLAGNAEGGGIGSGDFFTAATPTVSIANSTLSDNQAIGGTNINSSLNLLTSNPFAPADTGNSHGGGLGALASNVSVSNSTVTGNLSENGANQLASGGITFASGGTTYTFTLQENLGGNAFGGGIDDEFYPGHFITPAATPTLSIAGSTLSNNVALGNGGQGSGNGGGLSTSFVNAQLTNSTVNGNQATSGPGGGTYRTTGKAVTSKGAASTFSFSGSIPGGGTASGGGLLSVGGSLTISGSTMNGNAAKGSPGGTTNNDGFGSLIAGGGVYSSSQTLQLTNSTLRDNSAIGGNATSNSEFPNLSCGAAYGGALFLQGDAASVISGAAFVHNLAQGGVGIAAGGGGYGQGGGGGIGGFSGPLEVTNSLFQGNQAIGGVGGASGLGGVGQGGGFLNYQTSVTIDGSQFVQNQATGGVGGSGAVGGPAQGGGVWNIGSLAINGSHFVQNQATGGVGGSGAAGGASQGGGVWNEDSVMTINGSQFIANGAVGGAGGTGANGGNGAGGGLYNAVESSATIDGSQFIANGAIGGAGGTGANGGNGQGGGILNGFGAPFYDFSSLTLQNSQLHGNLAVGGAGGAGGNGGNGLGGDLFSGTGSTATLLGDAISGNIALGGAAGSGGSAGLGEGGGLYIDALAMVCADLATQQHLHGNHASTSNDDVFGTLGTCS